MSYLNQNLVFNLKYMNNEFNTDKIFIKQDSETTYIVHLVANQTSLSIQIENKINGHIWNGEFSAEKIQQITQRAKNPKKFVIFIKMLLTSFAQKSGSVITQILSFAQLQKKMNLVRKSSNNQAHKKFMIMTYMSQFQKTHYPLPLFLDENPSSDRLKVTIRRLSQQLQLNCQEKGDSMDSGNSKYIKQVSMLKYQNETLKAKLKNSESKLRLESKQNQNMNRSNLIIQESEEHKKTIQNLKKINQQKDSQIQILKTKLHELQKQSSKKDNTILNLKDEITELKEDMNEKQDKEQFQEFSDKLAQMAKETTQLVSELQHSREQQKKSTLRILNLQKQLEHMIQLQQKKVNQRSKYVVVDSSPMRSSRKSQVDKSQKSFRSQSSKKSYNSNNSKNSKNSKNPNPLISYLNRSKNLTKQQPAKKTSVYDSDTQSSKMRRMANNKVSPFRQTSKPVNNSPKRSNPLNNNRLQSGKNIVNNFQTRNRSRSKSKSVKKQISPPQNQDPSSDEGVTRTLAILKARTRRQNPKKANNSSSNNVLGPVEQKISKIAEMLRNAKKKSDN